MLNLRRRSSAIITILLLCGSAAYAQDSASSDANASATQHEANPPHLIMPALGYAGDLAPLTTLPDSQDETQPMHAAAVEHSDAYETRAKIHRIASYATLPLFATEVALGQSLYNGTGGGSMRGVHAAVGAGIVGLFGVNTVTGAWNLFGEGWKDPNAKKIRIVHGLLMMAADVGFLATEAYGPHGNGLRGAQTYQNDKVIHRNLAFASISVGTAGYLAMLFGGR